MKVYVSKLLKQLYPHITNVMSSYVEVKELETNNLWSRDYMPIRVGASYIKFSYRGYPKYAHMKVVEEVWKKFDTIESSIFLDGGNVVQNENIVFMTEKVFENNSLFYKREIREILETFFQKRIIYLPVEPGDKLGHSDGLVRVINDKLVMMNDYKTNSSPMWIKYGLKLENLLKNNGFEVVYLPWEWMKRPRITKSLFREKYPWADEFNPAFGYYINYYKIGNKIFFPIFNIEEDVKAVKIMEDVYSGIKIIPVDCSELSMMGGVLNCVTWSPLD